MKGVIVVIRSVEIRGLRGIREGKLTELSPLVVLVGPNGAGKNAVLEAILIGASPTTAEAIVEVIRRHEAGGSGPRWLLWKEGSREPTEIRITADPKVSRRCQLALDRNVPEPGTQILFTVMDSESRRGQGWVYG